MYSLFYSNFDEFHVYRSKQLLKGGYKAFVLLKTNVLAVNGYEIPIHTQNSSRIAFLPIISPKVCVPYCKILAQSKLKAFAEDIKDGSNGRSFP